MDPDILFICMDSCRYDVYVDAYTPNMDSVGKVRKLHSDACWTLPSIIAYMFNRPPIGYNKPLFPLPSSIKSGFIPKLFYEQGYVLAFLTSNAYVEWYDGLMNRKFSRWFHHWNIVKYLSDKNHATPIIINDAVEIAEKTEKPLFLFLLLMATHHPYFDGEKLHKLSGSTPKQVLEAQRRAVEYIDRLIKPLLDTFIKRGRENIIYITSDHGEDARYGHDPINHLEFNEQLFAIPFIRGKGK